MMLDVGMNKIRDIHAANIDRAWMGTAGVRTTQSMTGLQSGVSATKVAVSIVSSDKTNTINYTLPSTTATGITLREFAVILDGNTEYNRTTMTGIEHTENEDIVISQTIYYKNAD